MFEITEKDINLVKEKYIISKKPLKISLFPPKEKRKYILLCIIMHQFEKEKIYTEKDMNRILGAIYDDHVTIRRYLIMYRFFDRKDDGSAYWLIADPSEYTQYQ